MDRYPDLPGTQTDLEKTNLEGIPFCAQTTDFAPSFTAESWNPIEKKITNIKLEDLRRKWVILFFYASDFTFVWPTELAAVAAIHDQFKQLDAEILAISTDSVYSHKVFTEVSPSAAKVTFPLLSDRTHQISKAYRVLNPKTGATFRATVIIDPEGMIVTKLVNPLEVGRNVYEILRLLAGIQYGRQTGEGVPANWVPGQPGIIRDPKMIGKI